ncbi:hypothetical protein RIF29_36642 [Crotalaria pallida]|uniref:non-specific serine/threonine protein kinase n=1 Tax=Crotalaria pallida TaxID=3830 RepID=A0AAN9EDK4_CROPI
MNLFSLLSLIFWYHIYLHIFLAITLSLNTTTTIAVASALLGNHTDHSALLKFKESVSNDPYGVLDSWNSSTHFCNWHGVTCSPMHQRVIELNLKGYRLHGTISPQLGNLSLMRNLNLSNNFFHGRIPQELSHLSQLQQLVLSNNSLEGEFPTSLTNCSQLKGLRLYGNNLTGKIPFEIGSFIKLQILVIGQNKLTGQIPASVGNLSSLVVIFVAFNNLEGNIPQELAHLRNLKHIAVHVNKLSGAIPSYLYNMSSLNKISFAYNKFNGSLPPNMFNTLPNLQFFSIYSNQISGTIPTSTTNASLIQLLEFGNNDLVGPVPSMGKLQDLSLLNLEGNNLGNGSTNDLDFLKSLTNCSKLFVLSISVNNFGGCLPTFIGNFSTLLSELYVAKNEIYGKIPAELGNLHNLILLGMSDNHFDGIIPSTFGKFQKMQALDLSINNLSGDIPNFIGNLSQLSYLDLSQNMLQGNIPPSIGSYQMLQSLDLSQNNLRGTIPLEVFGLSSLTTLLKLSQNSLSGSLPIEVGRLKNIIEIDVSSNHLFGVIPEAIGECMSLEYLYLQGNSFHGIIPSSLASLKDLRRLDLSQNHLSGSIPKGLQNISVLQYLNVSFNKLDGEVPTYGVFQNSSGFAMLGNNKLCGGISKLHLSPCPNKGTKPRKHHNFKRLIAVIVCGIAFLFIFSLSLTFYWMSRRNKKPSPSSPTNDQLAKVSYQNLHNGTDGFSVRNLIGFGNFGSVYKGTLESEDRVVAIKVLNLQKKGAHKSFIAECNALRNIRHRNLVKILTCCSGSDYKGHDFKALVFEFMTNGSLESWLHPTMEVANDSKSLGLGQRLNIIIDVACALHYLHYDCQQAIIHCDLKPSNILLDDCLVAHVSDFGIARLITSIGVSSNHTSTIGIKGTIGYAPPEYGMGSMVSIEGDMYSFGILILEILSRRRPTDEMFKDGQNLHNYVKISIPNHLLHIVDPTILPKEIEQTADKEKSTLMHPIVKNCLLSLFRIALACSVETPKERMSMVDVTRELNMIKSSFASKNVEVVETWHAFKPEASPSVQHHH